MMLTFTGWGSVTARRTGGSWPGWSQATSSSPGFSASCSSRWGSTRPPVRETTTTWTTSPCTRSSTCRTTPRWVSLSHERWMLSWDVYSGRLAAKEDEDKQSRWARAEPADSFWGSRTSSFTGRSWDIIIHLHQKDDADDVKIKFG